MIASMTFIIRYHWKKINFNNGTFPKTSNEAFLMLDIYSMHYLVSQTWIIPQLTLSQQSFYWNVCIVCYELTEKT